MKMLAIVVERHDGKKLLGSWVKDPEDRDAGKGVKLELSAKEAEEIGALLTRLAQTALATSLVERCMNCGSDAECFDGSDHPRRTEPTHAGGICDICEKPCLGHAPGSLSTRTLCASPKCFKEWDRRDRARIPPRGTISQAP
jgi:hypothetical protein